MYRKPKEVNTEFVLNELNKIKKTMDELDKRLDFLFAGVLYEEVKKYTKGCKTITSGKLQKKFDIGYARASYLLSFLESGGCVKLDKEETERRVFIVNKEKFKDD